MCWVWSGPSCCPGAVPAAGTACAFRCLVREALWRSDGRAVEVLGLILPLSGRSPSDVLALERPVVMSRAPFLLLGPRVRFAASFGKLCGAPTGGGSRCWACPIGVLELGLAYRSSRSLALCGTGGVGSMFARVLRRVPRLRNAAVSAVIVRTLGFHVKHIELRLPCLRAPCARPPGVRTGLPGGPREGSALGDRPGEGPPGCSISTLHERFRLRCDPSFDRALP
jgi:hypothetical protein